MGLINNNNFCHKCGVCCRAIVLSKTKKEVKEIYKQNKNNTDALFILNNWFRISKQQAFKKNPYLKEWAKKEVYSKTNKNRVKFLVYTCHQFNEKTKSCQVYSKRPNICSKYPFDNISSILSGTFVFYTLNCAYNSEKFKKHINKMKEDIVYKQ